jgi:two-component system nitrate/nitrite response regulator NarL
MKRATTVVLADDHPAVLDSVGRILEGHGVDVVARTGDGSTALEAIEQHRPAVAVIDVRMPKLSGLDVARRAVNTTTVCVYTAHGERSLLLELVEIGVRWIVLKESPLNDLPRAVRALAQGGAYFDPVLAGVLVAADREQPSALSDRERNILRFLADGHRNDGISSALHIAPDTVRAHIRNAMRKLGAYTRTEAVATAMRRELIE